jgi:hypothetical protein
MWCFDDDNVGETMSQIHLKKRDQKLFRAIVEGWEAGGCVLPPHLHLDEVHDLLLRVGATEIANIMKKKYLEKNNLERQEAARNALLDGYDGDEPY